MPINFFASAETDTLYPFGGTEYWITVKKELSAGDERGIWQAAIRREIKSDAQGRVNQELNLESGAFEKISAWLVDWNLPAEDGKTRDIKASKQVKVDALRNMKAEHFTAIETAIDAHAKARAEEKKLQNTEPSKSGSKKNLRSVAS